MTYAFTSARLGGGNSAAAELSKPLPVFRGRKRNRPPASCRPVSDESRSSVETQTHRQETEAFKQMFVASRPKFVAMARAILRNREDAEDAVQNAFLSGYVHLRSFQGRSALTTWFTRIVLNSALMIRRRRKTSLLSETCSPNDTRWMYDIPASQPDPEMAYAEQEAFQFVDQLLGKMKPALRQAFTMTYYDELSGREASVLLGVAAGTFKARLFRARRQLLSQAQRTLAAPVRMTTHSAFFRDKNAFQTIVARRPDIASSEGSIS
jgi:RNA polymerase sigma-70 factor, ECF subfamily